MIRLKCERRHNSEKKLYSSCKKSVTSMTVVGKVNDIDYIGDDRLMRRTSAT